MLKDLKVYSKVKEEKYALVDVVKAELNTEDGPRNLVLWGKELDKNFILSSGLLRRVQKFYKNYNSELNINFEKVICKRFEREVYKRRKSNLVIVLSSLKDLFYFEEESDKRVLKSLEDMEDNFIKKIEIAHKNRGRIIFTTIPSFREEEELEELINGINKWLRESEFLDGIIDLDRLLKEGNFYKEDKEDLEKYLVEKLPIDYIVDRLKPFELDYKSQEELIRDMNENKRIIKEGHKEILLKGVPDPIEGSRIDRRVKYFNKHKRPEKTGDSYVFKGEAVGDMRNNMGLLNLDLCKKKILIRKEKIKGIDCRIYREENLSGEKNPCLIYIHGGAFIGGSLDVSENPCKLLAEKIKGIVISIDYSLAPENPYPRGLEDCKEVFKYIEENSKLYGIDKNKIGVLGESAGANYAAILANENNDLKFQGLVYPLVSFIENTPFFTWREELYDNRYKEGEIEEFINSLKGCEDLLKKLYIQRDIDLKDENISPIFCSDFSKSKRALVAVSEYDYLRVQGEAYGFLLKENNIKAKIIRYEGINHAFLDNLGIYPQAEDLIEEIAKEFLDSISF